MSIEPEAIETAILDLLAQRQPGLTISPMDVARRLGGLELFILDGDEFGAEALDLFLGGGAHVGGRDDRAQTPRRGDGL